MHLFNITLKRKRGFIYVSVIVTTPQDVYILAMLCVQHLLKIHKNELTVDMYSCVSTIHINITTTVVLRRP